MRPLALVLLLAACGAQSEPTADSRIECRIDGTNGFERVCGLEAADSAEGRILIVRKPDGGFRRLRVTDGAGIVAADGAERAEVARLGDGRSEVSIGGESFRLPASVRQ